MKRAQDSLGVPLSKQAKRTDRDIRIASSEQIDDKLLEVTMLNILEKRKAGATCCPSEIPRSLPLADWRGLMDRTREVALRLARDGVIDILQRGEVLQDLQNIRGPIRLRLRRD